MPEPCVTVLVPTRQRADYLRVALASVLAQTRQDLRVVVSDNASTDATAEVLAAVDDPRLEVLRHRHDLGMTGNFNAALERAGTPLVAWLLDDDAWDPRFLERTLPLFEDHPRVGLVHTAFRVVDEHGTEVDAHRDWHSGGPGRTGVRPGSSLLHDLLLASNPVMVSATVVRREALPPARWDARDVQAEDVGLWLRIALRWDAAFVAEPLATFRQHSTSTSVSAAHVVGTGTVPGYAQVALWRAVKERFLAEHGDALPEPELLRRGVAAKERADALETIAVLTEGSSPADVRQQMRAASRHVPGLWRDPRSWSLFAATLLGRHRVERWRGGLSAPRPSTEPSRRPRAR